VTPIFDMRMHDGSRHFGSLPETLSVTESHVQRLQAHVALLRDATIVGVVTDQLTEAWIDFHHAGHRFSMNNQSGDWWFFVADPACPDEVLRAVLAHFATILGQG
jgi:hypothetical protein